MSLHNDLRKATTGGDYTAVDVADWLAEQQNSAAAAGEKGRAGVIWSLLTAWSAKTAQD